eukprot:IDg6827t1
MAYIATCIGTQSSQWRPPSHSSPPKRVPVVQRLKRRGLRADAFHVRKADMPRMVNAIGWPSSVTMTMRNRYDASSILAACIVLSRVSTPGSPSSASVKFVRLPRCVFSPCAINAARLRLLCVTTPFSPEAQLSNALAPASCVMAIPTSGLVFMASETFVHDKTTAVVYMYKICRNDLQYDVYTFTDMYDIICRILE